LAAALALLALASALLALAAERRGAVAAFYALKPLTTALILALPLLAGGGAPPGYRWPVVAGLAFSLAGDVFLMLPSDRFLAGLASFLAAHVCYIAAFAGAAGPGADLVALAPFALWGGLMLAYVWPGLGAMRVPAVFYGCAIAAMGWQAAAAWRAVSTPPALFALAGAACFVLSDSALAANRFRGPLPAAQPVVLSSYWAAQLLIAWSVLPA
jgi:uncharacterized membrane protein YhhN